MAKLPIEPTISRMLLEAHEERAMTEVLVIAAGLSIQDPREFPLEKKEQVLSDSVAQNLTSSSKQLLHSFQRPWAVRTVSPDFWNSTLNFN